MVARQSELRIDESFRDPCDELVALRVHLMREAMRMLSEAISGNQWQSVLLSGHPSVCAP